MKIACILFLISGLLFIIIAFNSEENNLYAIGLMFITIGVSNIVIESKKKNRKE